MSFLFFLTINFLFIFGCVTTNPMTALDTDKVEKKWGSNCLNMEGGSQIVFKNSERRVSLTLDWLTDNQGVLTAEFSDPVGRPLGTVILDNLSLKEMGGAHLFKTSPVSFDVNGHILVGGYNTYIKPSELGCILGGKIPLDWLLDLQGGPQNWSSRSRDDVRKIQFQGSLEHTCGSVSGSGFWAFMTGKLNICQKEKSGKLYYGSDYFFEWSLLDGENS